MNNFYKKWRGFGTGLVVTGLFNLVPANYLFAQAQLSELNALTAGESLGAAIACRGPGLLVSAPHATNATLANAGRAFYYLPASAAPVNELPYNSPTAGAMFGSALAVVRDVSGDGLQDYIVGASQENSAAGAFYVYTDPGSGSFGPDIMKASGSTGDELGSSILGIDDLPTSDGRFEFAVGAPGMLGGAGGVFLFNGGDASSRGVLQGFGTERLGTSLALISDTNSDGIREIAGGAPQYNFSISFPGGLVGEIVFVNPVTASVSGRLQGSNSNEAFGTSLADAGDLNGDGTTDLLVGAPQRNDKSTSSGSVYLISGQGILSTPTILCSINPTDGTALFGTSVASVGDADLDGAPEFVVTEPSYGGLLGRVSVYRYSSGFCTLVRTFTGAFVGHSLGVSVAGNALPVAGGGGCDFNADGKPDFAVGTDSNNPSANTGSVVLYNAAAPTPIPTPTPTPNLTPTPTQVPTLTPTATPGDIAAPSSARLNFRLELDGRMTLGVEYDRAPKNTACSQTIYARITRGIRRDRVHVVGDRSYSVVSASNIYRARGLPSVDDIDGDRAIVHMTVRTRCDEGTQFLSNISSRYLSCGATRTLSYNRWYYNLNSTFEPVVDSAKRRAYISDLFRRKR